MDFTLRPFAAEDAGWVIERHAALYAAEEGFDHTFGLLVAGIVADFLSAPDPQAQAGWIAEGAGRRVGSVFVVPEAPEVAKLRLVLIEPQARGTGLAQAMMDCALDFARSRAYRRMRLWTHESHVAAGRLYARNGFVLTSSEAKPSFGRDVVAQIWERAL